MKSRKNNSKRPNILIICTDQQRSLQHFPEGWAGKNLPWYTHLQKTGVTFKNNMCSSTACSPSRSTIFTSTYPTINGVLKVNDTLQMSRTLPMGGTLTTLGQIMTQSGYQMAYKGKWHLDNSFAAFSNMRPSDKDRMMIEDEAMENHYKMPEWTSPDLGTGESNSTDELDQKGNSALNTIGGGEVDNDNRIVNGPMYDDRQTSAKDFLQNYKPEEKPFCLVVSLANPHDIWVYPYTYGSAGYTDEVWKGAEYDDFKLPENFYRSLHNKPASQMEFLLGFQGGPLKSEDTALEYLKFYAYLHTLIDDLTGDIIKSLRTNKYVGDQLEQDTLIIRLSDHGEMAMSQGGLRQKENNCYNETIRVPMIFSNPNLPQGEVRHQFVSLIDLLPTLCEVTDTTIEDGLIIQGKSYAALLEKDGEEIKEVNYFATDDGSLTQYTSIRAIIHREYKYAVYFKADYNSSQNAMVNYNGSVDMDTVIQYELYDYTTHNGRIEIDNLLNDISDVNDELFATWKRLHTELTKHMIESFTSPKNWDYCEPTTVSTLVED